MELIWRDQLSVGNDVIDQDHKYLIDIINRVKRCLENQDRVGLSATLDSLYQYSRVHFAREERIAYRAGYAQATHLGHSHEKLIEHLDEISREIHVPEQDWSPQAIAKFTALLHNWLVDHVIKEDLLMKPTLQRYPPDFGGS